MVFLHFPRYIHQKRRGDCHDRSLPEQNLPTRRTKWAGVWYVLIFMHFKNIFRLCQGSQPCHRCGGSFFQIRPVMAVTPSFLMNVSRKMQKHHPVTVAGHDLSPPFLTTVSRSPPLSPHPYRPLKNNVKCDGFATLAKVPIHSLKFNTSNPTLSTGGLFDTCVKFAP